MIPLNLIPYLLLSTFVTVSWTFFSPCHAYDSAFLQGLPTDGIEYSTLANTSTIPLAAERTRRVDPSSDFTYYEGGWDITNRHYIMSVAFSGIPLFAVAFLWCFTVAICFIIIAFFYCCGCAKNKSRTNYSRKTYAISLIFLSLFFIMTIIGGVFLYIGQGKFQSTANDVSAVLVTRANAVVDIVHNVVNNLQSAKNIQIGQFYLPDDVKESIGKVQKLASQTDVIKIQSEKTAKASTQLLNDVSQSLIIISTLMLILAIVGFIISIFGLKFIVYFLLFIGWILVTSTYMMGGVSLIVHNGVADTCLAMEEWLKHPQDHTALSKLLPCMDEAAAQRTMDITRNTTFQIVNLVNAFVINIANSNSPPLQGQLDVYFNQSGPLMPLLCNPFFPNLTQRSCASVEIDLKGAPLAYQSYVCNISASGLCNTMGRLTPSLYTKVMVATNMSDTLHRYGPLLARLVDCSFITETFSLISKEECSSLRRNSNQVFIGLLLLSVAVMFSVILWLVFVRERCFQISSNKLRRMYLEIQ